MTRLLLLAALLLVLAWILRPRRDRWYWTKEWQAGEVAADADLAAGRTVRFGSADEAIRWLTEPEVQPLDPRLAELLATSPVIAMDGLGRPEAAGVVWMAYLARNGRPGPD